MDRKFDGHARCKLQTNNIKNLFGLGFKTTKCLKHLCCQNDFSPLFLSYPMHNEISCLVGIICNFKYLDNVSWNPQSIPSTVSSTILCPYVYKLVVAKCIMLSTSFQISQEPQFIWGPMPIWLQTTSVENPSKKWRTCLKTRAIARQLLPFQLLFCLWIRHFFVITCSTRMEKVMWSFSKVNN
jgi:hypothetical protein